MEKLFGVSVAVVFNWVIKTIRYPTDGYDNLAVWMSFKLWFTNYQPPIIAIKSGFTV